MVIPLVIIMIVYWASFNIKNSVAEVKINKLKTEQARSNSPDDAYETSKQIERYRYLQQFPEGLLQEMKDRKGLTTKISFLNEDIESVEAEILLNNEDYGIKMQNIQNQIDSIRKSIMPDANIEALLKAKDRLQIEFTGYRSAHELKISKLNIDIKYLELKNNQLPYLFFFGGLWLVIFGSAIGAFGLSYIGNVLHQVYIFKNNNQKSEWRTIVERAKERDYKQPLLGGTLFVITLVLLYLVVSQIDVVENFILLIGSQF
jgi:hypothetical protein